MIDPVMKTDRTRLVQQTFCRPYLTKFKKKEAYHDQINCLTAVPDAIFSAHQLTSTHNRRMFPEMLCDVVENVGLDEQSQKKPQFFGTLTES